MKTKGDKQEIVQVEAHPIDVSKPLVMAMTIEALKDHLHMLEEVKGLLKADVHYRIDRRGKKVMKRSGFALYGYIFNLSDDILKEEELHYPEPRTWKYHRYVSRGPDKGWQPRSVTSTFRGHRITVRVVHQMTGRYATGVGACVMDEENIIAKMGDGRWFHDTYGTAHTRALNRAISNIIGSAEISAEELGGDEGEPPEEAGAPPEAPRQKTESYKLPGDFKAPDWNFEETLKEQGWDNAESLLRAWIRDSGIDIQAFKNPESDGLRAWIRPQAFFGDSFEAVSKMLAKAKFIWRPKEKRWVLMRPKEIK